MLDWFYAATLLHVCHKLWPLSGVLAFLIPASVQKTKQRHADMAVEKVRRRMRANTDRPDFMSHLMRNAEKEKLSTEVVEAQASVIILAGSEATGLALAAATYYVLSNHHIWEKLRDEVRGRFSAASELDILAVSKLPYLAAVVQETLRINPPLPNGFSREVPRGGAMVSGHMVPEGVRLFFLIEFRRISFAFSPSFQLTCVDRGKHQPLLRVPIGAALP